MVFILVLKKERSNIKCLELLTFSVENLYILLMYYIKNELLLEKFHAYKIVLENFLFVAYGYNVRFMRRERWGDSANEIVAYYSIKHEINWKINNVTTCKTFPYNKHFTN